MPSDKLPRLAVFPITGGVLMIVTLVLLYIIAVAQDHVTAIFPFISQTFVKQPESSIIALFGGIVAVCYMLTVYTRFRMVSTYCTKQITEEQSNNKTLRSLLKTNKAALACGMLMSSGLWVSVAFNALDQRTVHSIGATFNIFAGTSYFVLQAWLAYQLPQITQRKVRNFRIAVAILLITIIVVNIIVMIDGSRRYRSETPIDQQLHWKPSDGGYYNYVAAAVLQWTLALLFNFEMMSSVFEIKRLKPSLQFALQA